jgi:hypothetical protein
MLNNKKFKTTQLATFVALSLGLVGCNGGDEASTPAPTPPVIVETPTTTETTLGSVVGQVKISNLAEDGVFTTGVSIRATLITEESYTAQGFSAQAASNGEESGIYTTSTDSTGKFVLNLPAGFYNIEAQSGVTNKAMVQTVVTASSSVDLDFVLTATGSISGDISEEENDGVQGRLVYIPGTSYNALTNREGEFVISNVPVGTYSIVYYDEVTGNDITRSVNVNPGDNQLGEENTTEAPKVSYSSLSDDEVSPDEFVEEQYFAEIQFTQAMDIETTEAAIAFDKTMGELTFQWYNNNAYVQVFLKSDNMPYGDASLVVNTTATNTKGVALAESIFLDFVVNETVSSIWPSDGEEVYLGNADQYGVYVNFSDDMNRGSVIVNISPEVPGLIIEWQDNEQFKLRGVFAADTEYNIEISAGETTAGQVLSGLPFTSSLINTKAKVVESFPAQGTVEVDPDNIIEIALNAAVNRDSLEDALSFIEVLGDGTEQVISKELYSIDWFEGDYWNGEQANNSRERFYINYQKSVSTHYKVIIDLAKTTTLDDVALGDEGENYELAFSTLIPRLTNSWPNDNGTQTSSYIYLSFNTEVDTDEAVFTVVDIEGNQFEIDDITEQGLNVYMFPQGLKPETEYVFSYQGLKAGDTAIPDGQIKFMTQEAMVDWSSPSYQDSNVGLTHRVTFDFNVVVEDDYRQGMEQALVITPDDNERDVNFIWGDTWRGDSRLYVNYTFEANTNYLLAFNTDDAKNIIIKDGETDVNTGIKQYTPLSFSTINIDPTDEDESNIQSVRAGGEEYYNNPIELSPGTQYVELYFNRMTKLEQGDVVLVDANGETREVDLDNSYYCGGNTLYVNQERYCSMHQMPLTGLKASSDYTLQLVGMEMLDISAYCSQDPNAYVYGEGSCQELLENGYQIYFDELPINLAELEITAPNVYYSIDNVNGFVELNNSGDYYFKTDELVLTFEPALEVLNTFSEQDGNAEEDANTGDMFISREHLVYRPEPFSNIQVTIPALTAYERNVAVDEVTGEETITFTAVLNDNGENVIYEGSGETQVRNVTPSLTAPKLLNVSQYSLNSIELLFNVKMDAEIANNLDNYELSCVSGSAEAVSYDVLATTIAEDAYSTERFIGLMTADLPIDGDTVCTVALNNFVDFSGNYMLDDGTSMSFDAMSGSIYDVVEIYVHNEWDSTEETHTWTKSFIVKSDVMFDEDQVQTMVMAEFTDENVDYEINLTGYQLSNSGMEVRLDFTWATPQNYDSSNFQLFFADEITNLEGGELSIDVSSNNQYSPWSGESEGNVLAYFNVDTSRSDFFGENGTPFIIMNLPNNDDAILDDVLNLDSYSLELNSGEGALPVITTVEDLGDGSFKLSLSASLELYTSYQLYSRIGRIDSEVAQLGLTPEYMIRTEYFYSDQ